MKKPIIASTFSDPINDMREDSSLLADLNKIPVSSPPLEAQPDIGPKEPAQDTRSHNPPLQGIITRSIAHNSTPNVGQEPFLSPSKSIGSSTPSCSSMDDFQLVTNKKKKAKMPL